MTIQALCISFIATILGVGFPLTFNAISKFDEKYSSDLIIEIFNKKSLRRLFKSFLFSSLIISLLYVINSVLFIFFDREIFSIANRYISYLLVLSSTLLIISFIHFTLTIVKFSTPLQLFNLLMREDLNKNDENNFIYLNAISDLLVQTIKSEKTITTEKISNYIFDLFEKYDETFSGDRVLYPTPFYDLVYRTSSQLIKSNAPELRFLEYNTIGGYYFFNVKSDKFLHPATLQSVWKMLVDAAVNGKDDQILFFWNNANRYFDTRLSSDEPYRFHVSLAVSEVDSELKIEMKSEFLEFSYFLGGLLIYYERYECVKRLWDYTNSEPPDYPLLPNTLGEVLEIFFKFQKDNQFSQLFKASKFPFPKQDGIRADRVVLNWVSKYIALLFLRQYTLHSYYGDNPFFVSYPDTQAERKNWIENIDTLTNTIQYFVNDNKVLNQLNLNYLKDDNFYNSERLKPIDLIEKTKSEVIRIHDETQITQGISLFKEQQFINKTSEILTDAFKDIDISIEEINDYYSVTKLVGTKQLFEKMAFADDQGITHLNFDTFLASHLASDIRVLFSISFFRNSSERYKIEEEKVFEAIDNCIGTNNTEEFIIVAFRTNLQYYLDILKIPELTATSYRGIKILNFDVCEYRLVGNSYFILRTSDLPKLTILEPEENEVRLYDLRPIHQPYKIYSKVVNLNERPDIKDLYKGKLDDAQLDKSVLACIAFNHEIRWKKGIAMKMIKTYYKFDNQGLPNSLDEIKSFTDKK